jgi:hypothetical protein
MHRVMQSPSVSFAGMMDNPVNKTNAPAPPSRHVVTPIHVMASIPAAGFAYFSPRSPIAELTPNNPKLAGERMNAYVANARHPIESAS